MSPGSRPGLRKNRCPQTCFLQLISLQRDEGTPVLRRLELPFTSSPRQVTTHPKTLPCPLSVSTSLSSPCTFITLHRLHTTQACAWKYLPPPQSRPLWEANVYMLHCITHRSSAKTPSHSEAPKHKIHREIRSPLRFSMGMDGEGVSACPTQSTIAGNKPTEMRGLSPRSLQTLGTGGTRHLHRHV